MAQANSTEGNKSQAQSGQSQGQQAQGQRMAQAQGQSGQQGKGGQELLRRGGGRAGAAMRPFEDLERMFEGFFPRGLRPFGGGMFDWPTWERSAPLARMQTSVPAVNVIDHENEIVVRAEVPGCRREDLDISMSDSTLTIRGHNRQEQQEQSEDYYYNEISYGEFSRSVSLPTDVNADQAQASIKDGILEVTLPKAETSKRRSIKVE